MRGERGLKWEGKEGHRMEETGRGGNKAETGEEQWSKYAVEVLYYIESIYLQCFF